MMVALTVTSCKTQQLYLNVTQPAPVTIPSYVKEIGVIDRTAPTEETKKIDKIENALSLEGSDLDSLGKKENLAGLSDELLVNDRFTRVADLTSLNFRTSSMGNFPEALNWTIIEKLCAENNIHAVFALELYDTDTHVQHTTTQETKNNPLLSALLEPNTSIETIVKTGWRIYEPQQRAILDEYVISRSFAYTGSLASTAIGFAKRTEAVKSASLEAGHDYAIRLLPYTIRVTRDYYVKGTSNFTAAMRKAQNGKWDEAGQLWEKETTNNDPDIAGRACYNMAIINEINGNLAEAIGWSEKAYEDYGNKLARDYTRILKNRQSAIELLKVQEER